MQACYYPINISLTEICETFDGGCSIRLLPIPWKGKDKVCLHFGKSSVNIMERVFFLEKGDLFFIDL